VGSASLRAISEAKPSAYGPVTRPGRPPALLGLREVPSEERLREALREPEASDDEELRELKRRFAQILAEEAKRYYGSGF
jgi:hypothetical protein